MNAIYFPTVDDKSRPNEAKLIVGHEEPRPVLSNREFVQYWNQKRKEEIKFKTTSLPQATN